MKLRLLLAGVILLCLGSQGAGAPAAPAVAAKPGAPDSGARGPMITAEVKRAERVITADLLRAHTAYLASDLLEGRAPGARGGELAAAYIAAQFERLGLKPGGDHGTYFQNVPMLGKKVEPTASLRVERNGQAQTYKFFDDFVAFTDLEQEQVRVEGQLVFVGYGITAPEYSWDDFKGANLNGKVLVMLVNDPPATPEEPDLFGGKALTYYGRWTYKYESAARQGALGAILIHTTESAGYPFQVVQSSWSGEQFSLPRQPGDPAPLGLKAWVSDSVAQQIFTLAGLDLNVLRQAATRRDFRPVEMALRVTADLTQHVRRIESANVIGVLPGSDPRLREQYVVYTAHYDHFGIGREVKGDRIYNGAADNAIGVAALLGIAEGMARLAADGRGAKRTQVFAAVTAEEAGLLGSAYYAQNPPFPPARTVANINMDGLNQWGPTRDIVQIGAGKSELDEVARIAARANHLQLKPDQFPEKGFFYRSDQFSLAKVGIPALYFDNGLDMIGKPADYGKKKFDEYLANDYHQPSDQIKPDWDWRGAEQMASFLFEVGWKVANWNREFNWYPTAEFRAIREESLKKTQGH